MLNEYYISPAISKKILYMGCEKLYLRFVIVILFAALFISLVFDWIQDSPAITLLIIGVDVGLLVLLGQIIAASNPYKFQIMVRHLSYQSAYYAQKKYRPTRLGLLALIPLIKAKRENSGHRTYEDFDRNM